MGGYIYAYIQSVCVLEQISQMPTSHKRDIPSHVFQEGKQKPAITMLNNFNKGRSTELRKCGYVTEDSSTGEVSADCTYISVLERPFTAVIFHNLSNREVCISSKVVFIPRKTFFFCDSVSQGQLTVFFSLATSCC